MSTTGKRFFLFIALLCGAAAAPSKVPVVQCGTVIVDDVTFLNSDVNDYYVTVNASNFTIVATNWQVDPSALWCEPYVMLNVAPNGEGSYGPLEREIDDGDSFELLVPSVNPPADSFDVFFYGGICDYTVRMQQFEVVCP